MIALLMIVLFFFLLIGIYKRSGRPKGGGKFSCPYCKAWMHRKATVCASCGRESRMYSRWDHPPPPKGGVG
jgi:hypothetical protein